jgi:phosphate transport system permease protein
MKRFDYLVSIASGICVIITIGFLIWILTDIVWFGARTISLKFLTQPPSEGMTGGGIFPAIFGTVLLVFIMTVFLLPFGVMAGIYLAEYAPQQSILTQAIRLAINNLAGVPSIVFGLFGVGFFIQYIGRGLDKAFRLDMIFSQPSLLWAGLTLAVLNLPVVIKTSEEAIKAVPFEHREAAYALGATKLQTIWRVVLPQAFSGILTGAVLSISRGAGEVAPIMFTGTAYFLPHLPKLPTDQFMELGYHIYVMSTQSPDIEKTKPILYGTILVLLLLTLTLNAFAIIMRIRYRRRYV